MRRGCVIMPGWLTRGWTRLVYRRGLELLNRYKGVCMTTSTSRRLAAFFLITIGLAVPALAQEEAALPAPLETAQAKANYGIGRQIGRQLLQGGLEVDMVDLPSLVAGLEDAIGNKEARITQAEFEAAMQEFQQAAQQRMQAKMQALSEKNKTEGPKFLEKYKAMEGVKALPSGLLYKVVKAAEGPSPKETDMVKTHYRGRLVDGTEFDSSYKRNEPAVFPVNRVIAGWTEALQLMKVGEKWQLAIPSELAYGEQGSPPVIGPNAVLVFDIELLGIEENPQGLPGENP